MSRVPEGLDRNELYVVARRVLLDALVALREQSDAVTIVGAQAIYLHSVDVELAVTSFTSNADLGLDPDRLADVPLLEEAMTAAGFVRGVADHAGSWIRGQCGRVTVIDGRPDDGMMDKYRDPLLTPRETARHLQVPRSTFDLWLREEATGEPLVHRCRR